MDRGLEGHPTLPQRHPGVGLGDREDHKASLRLDYLNCLTMKMCSYITCEIKNKLKYIKPS